VSKTFGSAHVALIKPARELKQRSNLTYAGLPDSLKLREEDISDPAMPNQTMYTRLLTKMDNLQILFLLERLLIKYGRADGQELLDTASELLCLKLVFWKQRDRFLELQGINEFFVSSSLSTNLLSPGAGVCIDV